jgi:hypothetical protein
MSKINLVEQFHKVKFFFNENEKQNILNVYQDIEILSDANELYAKDGGGDFSLYLGESYFCLDFDTQSKRVGNFGGIINLYKVKSGHVYLPQNPSTGVLYVCGESAFTHGGGWRFEFDETYTFDREKSILQIGKYNADLQCCKFLKNAYCQLDSKGNLVCLLISDIKLSV